MATGAEGDARRHARDLHHFVIQCVRVSVLHEYCFAVAGKERPRMQVAHMLPNLRLHPMTQNYLPCREESDAERRQGRQTVQEEMIVHVCHRVISPCLQRHMSQRATSRSHFLPPLLRPVRVINCLWCLALPGSRR